MEREYEIKCEMKKCCICKKYIEYSNQRVFVNHRHYHRCCLDNLWLQIGTEERYKIIDHFIQEDMKSKCFLKWFGYVFNEN